MTSFFSHLEYITVLNYLTWTFHVVFYQGNVSVIDLLYGVVISVTLLKNVSVKKSEPPSIFSEV